ncbi:unnamed protein product [Rotaria sordida]|uniref:Uncharacterized protein n=1 Tax=Rotaria sordida TaxID=392033 RepID=A0A815NW58_9BILA|nr:unnamed protein product [Rotaria sordida]CAF1647249.1 unnamed protein product [Rotaria sordida]
MNVKKLVSLAFIPVTDVLKAYSSIKNDFDYEDYPLLDYFECVSAGQKKERVYSANLGSRRGKPKFSLQL